MNFTTVSTTLYSWCELDKPKHSRAPNISLLLVLLLLLLLLLLVLVFVLVLLLVRFSFFFETLTLVGLTPLELLVKHFSKISESIDARSEALPLVVHHTESVVAHRRARGAPFAGKKQDVSFCTWRSERPVACPTVQRSASDNTQSHVREWPRAS